MISPSFGSNSPKLTKAGAAFKCGTLTYSKGSLISLFGWLLWGDFTFTLMEQVMPSLLPLILKSHGASSHELIFITSTLFLMLNAALNPVISYQSDRFRSRWGRRRPFIVVTTPLVVLFLAAIPFAPEILTCLQSIESINHLLHYIPIAPIMLVFGFLVAGFQVFNMFISSVYFYLIPDVVPLQFIGRFSGLFRVFGSLAGMFFNYFVFSHAEDHMRPIFVLTALLYGVVILLMCWRVKEGEYPPPPIENHSHWWKGIQNYARECFGHSYYWWVFLAYSTLGWGSAGNAFTIFFYQQELGFSLELYGQLNAWTGFLYICLAYPFGALMDRWGSHKTLILGTSLTLVCSLLMFFFASNTWNGFGLTLLRSAALALSGLALGKWTIDVYPSDRYGQFGSAGALFSSIGGILAASAFAWWLDWFKIYRCFLIWNAFFAAIALFVTVIVYRRWRILGGPSAYSPP